MEEINTMKQPLLIVTMSIVVLLLGCTDNKGVQLVKEGRLTMCPSKSIDEMVSGYMGSPSWDSGVAEDGSRFVNIGGDVTWQDEPVRAVLQFFVDVDERTFQFNALEVNDVPTPNLFGGMLLKEMCGEAVVTNTDSRSGIKAEVMDGLSIAAGAKAAVTEYFMDLGKMPADNYDAGLDSPENIRNNSGYSIYVTDGQILISLDNASYDEIRGKTIRLTPDTSGGLSVNWTCSAPDISEVYLPSACQI